MSSQIPGGGLSLILVFNPQSESAEKDKKVEKNLQNPETDVG